MVSGALTTDSPLATVDDIRRLQEQIAELVKTLDRIVHDQQIQFTRIAQLQADLDLVRGAWSQVKPPITRPEYTGPERRKTARKRQ